VELHLHGAECEEKWSYKVSKLPSVFFSHCVVVVFYFPLLHIPGSWQRGAELLVVGVFFFPLLHTPGGQQRWGAHRVHLFSTITHPKATTMRSLTPLRHHGLFFSIVVDPRAMTMRSLARCVTVFFFPLLAHFKAVIMRSSAPRHRGSFFQCCTPQGCDDEELDFLSSWSSFSPLLHTPRSRWQNVRLLVIVVFFFSLLCTEGCDDEELRCSSLWSFFSHCCTF
jgi:hypothetical protein